MALWPCLFICHSSVLRTLWLLCSQRRAQHRARSWSRLQPPLRCRGHGRGHVSALRSLARLSPWSGGAVSALNVTEGSDEGRKRNHFPTLPCLLLFFLKNPDFCLVTFVFSPLWRACSRRAAGAGFRHLHFCRTFPGLRGFQAARPSHRPSLASRAAVALSHAWRRCGFPSSCFPRIPSLSGSVPRLCLCGFARALLSCSDACVRVRSGISKSIIRLRRFFPFPLPSPSGTVLSRGMPGSIRRRSRAFLSYFVFWFLHASYQMMPVDESSSSRTPFSVSQDC